MREGRGTAVVKRSLTIAGHQTSISLEDAFWTGLRDIAAHRALPLAGLVADIDRARGEANLSSAIRVFVLEHRGEAVPSQAGWSERSRYDIAP